MEKAFKHTGRVVLIEQEGGYAAPIIKLVPNIGNYIQPQDMDEVFENLCGKKLEDLHWKHHGVLDCGLFEITIKRIDKKISD